MASNKIVKGNKVQLSTFLKWDVHDIFGHKIIEEGGSKFVNFVWCKLCAKTGIEITVGYRFYPIKISFHRSKNSPKKPITIPLNTTKKHEFLNTNEI